MFASIRLTCALALGVACSFMATPAAAAEQRCAQLGSSCSCSEPLDTTSYTADPNGDGRWINPSDSPAATECKGELGGGGSWYRNNHAQPEQEQQMPAGNSVTHVWRNKAAHGVAHITGSKPKSTSRRMCIRHYFNLSSNYSAAISGTGCGANKTLQLNLGGNSILHMGQKGEVTRWRFNGYSFTKTGAIKVLPRSGPLVIDDCRDTWCRVEACVSGDLSSRSNLFSEGYIVRISDGKRVDWPRFDLGNATSAGGSKAPWIANMFRQADPPGDCTGDRAFSHAMQAEWTTDAGQLIGAAYEVEGGSGGGGTTTPPPTQPPPTQPPPTQPPPTGPLNAPARPELLP